MPIGHRIRTQGGNDVRTRAYPYALNDRCRRDAHHVIAQVNASNVWGNIGTFYDSDEFRADRQNPPPAAVNIQIQKNGAPNPSTIACVIIPTEFQGGYSEMNAPNPHNDPAIDGARDRGHARHRELSHHIHRALLQSMASITAPANRGGDHTILVYEIHGDYSA